MHRTITALYDTREHAQRAQDQLRQIGVTDVRLTDQGSGLGSTSMGAGSSGGSGSTLTGAPDSVRDVSEGDYGRGHDDQGGGSGGGGGFWKSLKNLFSDDDRSTYEEGLRRGHVLLTAQVDDDRTDEAIRVLEGSDAIDVDQRSQEWRSAGWTGGVAGHVGDDRLTGHQSDDSMRGPSSNDEVRLHEGDRLTGSEEVIPVVEERLAVGKREVERGGVRVRSYVSERPVHEQVRLHEEHVSIERRPVDQPLSAATDADLFRERTIEVTEHAEEAVVAKEARVVEELVVNKTAEERTETIDDTVRRTEVDVDDSHRAGMTGETRAFTSTETTDAGLDPTSGEIPGETDEERRRRLAYSSGGGTTPSI